MAAPAIVRAGSLMPVKAMPIQLEGWTGRMVVSNPTLRGLIFSPAEYTWVEGPMEFGISDDFCDDHKAALSSLQKSFLESIKAA